MSLAPPDRPLPGRRAARRPSAADVLAPRVDPAAVAWTRPFGPVVRVLCGALALLCTAAFLVTATASALAAYRDPTVQSSDAVPDAAQVTSYTLILLVAGLALLAAAGAAGRRAVGFPGGWTPYFRPLFVGSTATVYVPLVVCTTAYTVLAYLGAAEQPNSPQTSTLVGLAASISSGISEEVFVVVVPVALLGPLVGWAARSSHGAGGTAFVVLVALMVTARLSYHVYYGWVALVLLPWALLTALVYLRTRAVVPLMICHVAYDVVLQLGGLGVLLVAGGAVAAAVVGLTAVSNARAAVDRPTRPTEPDRPGEPGVSSARP